MKCNVGKTDRLIRLVVGLILVVLGIWLHSWLVVILGVIILVTAVFKFCPLYLPLKMDTTEKPAA
jgi:type IV secretory pathway TrbD component